MDNLSLKVENIVTKGEIACFVQFILLSLMFSKKPSAAEASESVYMRERVNLHELSPFITMFSTQLNNCYSFSYLSLLLWSFSIAFATCI